MNDAQFMTTPVVALCMARVSQCVRGKALKVAIDDCDYAVSGQAEHVSYLYLSDRVLVSIAEADVIIVARLLAAEQAPAFHWRQTAHDTLDFSFGGVSQSISPYGQLQMSAQSLRMDSDDDIYWCSKRGSIQCFTAGYRR